MLGSPGSVPCPIPSLLDSSNRKGVHLELEHLLCFTRQCSSSSYKGERTDSQRSWLCGVMPMEKNNKCIGGALKSPTSPDCPALSSKDHFLLFYSRLTSKLFEISDSPWSYFGQGVYLKLIVPNVVFLQLRSNQERRENK